MKLFQILFLLITFQSVSSADIIKNLVLLDKKTSCIYKDYYVNDTRFYYHMVNGDNWKNTGSDLYSSTIIDGYVYDTETENCYPDKWLILGMDIKDYNFLMALIGVLIGFTFLFFISLTFINIVKR